MASVLAGSDLQDLQSAAATQADLATSVFQAIQVSRRIGAKQLKIPLNPDADGKLMMRRPNQAPFRVGSMRFSVIGPTGENLLRLRRDWKTLGPKLRGKLKIYVGDMDNYYLNNAVYLVEDFLKNVTDPPADAEIDYGDRAEHCWNGDHTRSNAYSRLRYHQMFIPRIMDQIRRNHPAGADTVSWRY